MKTTLIVISIILSLTLQTQKIIIFEENSIKGVVFTKEYFANSKQNFTPELVDIRDAEKQIKEEDRKLENYYRQYIGRNVLKMEIVIQLIPKDRIKFYKNWNKNYIYIQDDIEVRYVYYDLETKKINIKAKDHFGG